MIKKKNLNSIYISIIITFVLVIIVFMTLIFINKLPMSEAVRDIIVNIKNSILNEETLPQYELNKENFKEIYYSNLKYEITDKELEANNIEDPIGKISENITSYNNFNELNKEKNNETKINLNFGWVYKIKIKNSRKNIAIKINDKYYLAEEKIDES